MVRYEVPSRLLAGEKLKHPRLNMARPASFHSHAQLGSALLPKAALYSGLSFIRTRETGELCAMERCRRGAFDPSWRC